MGTISAFAYRHRETKKNLSFYLNKHKACTGNGNNFIWKT